MLAALVVCAALALRHPVAEPPLGRARLVGLSHHGELNGVVADVVGHARDGAYLVRVRGELRRVKPSHLSWVQTAHAEPAVAQNATAGSGPEAQGAVQGPEVQGPEAQGQAQRASAKSAEVQRPEGRSAEARRAEMQEPPAQGFMQDPQAQGPETQGSQSANAESTEAQGADAQGADAQGADAQGADAQGADAQGADAQGEAGKETPPKARLQGLKHDPELNGLEVQVMGFDVESKRYLCKLPDGSVRKLTRDHLADESPAPAPGPAQDEAVVQGMTHDTSLNGQHVHVLGFDKASGRYVVKFPSGAEKKVTAAHLKAPDEKPSLSPKDKDVVLQGMKHDRSLNGQHVKVLGLDKKSGRYVVKLPDGSERKVTAEHLGHPGPEHARIVGMEKQRELDDHVVDIVAQDPTTGRFEVEVEGHLVGVKEEHLMDVDEPAEEVVGDVVNGTLVRRGRRTPVEVLGFDSGRGEFEVASVNGSGFAELDELDADGRDLARLAINRRQRPRVTFCNAYPSRHGVTVVMRHGNRTNDALLVKNLRYSSCVDAEYPSSRGTLVFLVGDKVQIGEYVWWSRDASKRDALVLWRDDPDSLEGAVLRARIPANAPQAQVLVFNAYAGNPHKAPAMRAYVDGGAAQPMHFNHVYDLSPGHYEFALRSPDFTDVRAQADLAGGQTYVVVATGVTEGVEGEPTPLGLLMHGSGFAVAETATPVRLRGPTRALPVLLQSAAMAMATVLFAAVL